MIAKDDNGMPLLYGVSHLDGVTPVQIKFMPNGRMLMDFTTSISYNPAIVTLDEKVAKGTSSADDLTVLPITVNASTGAVLADKT